MMQCVHRAVRAYQNMSCDSLLSQKTPINSECLLLDDVKFTTKLRFEINVIVLCVLEVVDIQCEMSAACI